MKITSFFAKENAGRFASFLKFVSYFACFFFGVSIILILLGRVQMTIVTPTEVYERALLLEQDYGAQSRFLFVDIAGYDLTLTLQGGVDFVTWLSVALLTLVKMFPMAFCFFFLIRFFGNIEEGRVFVKENGNFLWYNGIALLIATVLGPIMKYFIVPLLMQSFSENILRFSITDNFLTIWFYSAFFLVGSYVFHYGLYLQEEADHTL